MTLFFRSIQLQTHNSPDLPRVSSVPLFKHILNLCTFILRAERTKFALKMRNASPFANSFYTSSKKYWQVSTTPARRWVQYVRFTPQFPVCKQKQSRVRLGSFNIFTFPRSLTIFFVFLLVHVRSGLSKFLWIRWPNMAKNAPFFPICFSVRGTCIRRSPT